MKIFVSKINKYQGHGEMQIHDKHRKYAYYNGVNTKSLVNHCKYQSALLQI